MLCKIFLTHMYAVLFSSYLKIFKVDLLKIAFNTLGYYDVTGRKGPSKKVVNFLGRMEKFPLLVDSKCLFLKFEANRQTDRLTETTVHIVAVQLSNLAQHEVGPSQT